jgi:hypothetical protein
MVWSSSPRWGGGRGGVTSPSPQHRHPSSIPEAETNRLHAVGRTGTLDSGQTGVWHTSSLICDAKMGDRCRASLAEAKCLHPRDRQLQLRLYPNAYIIVARISDRIRIILAHLH